MSTKLNWKNTQLQPQPATAVAFSVAAENQLVVPDHIFPMADGSGAAPVDVVRAATFDTPVGTVDVDYSFGAPAYGLYDGTDHTSRLALEISSASGGVSSLDPNFLDPLHDSFGIYLQYTIVEGDSGATVSILRKGGDHLVPALGDTTFQLHYDETTHRIYLALAYNSTDAGSFAVNAYVDGTVDDACHHWLYAKVNFTTQTLEVFGDTGPGTSTDISTMIDAIEAEGERFTNPESLVEIGTNSDLNANDNPMSLSYMAILRGKASELFTQAVGDALWKHGKDQNLVNPGVTIDYTRTSRVGYPIAADKVAMWAGSAGGGDVQVPLEFNENWGGVDFLSLGCSPSTENLLGDANDLTAWTTVTATVNEAELVSERGFREMDVVDATSNGGYVYKDITGLTAATTYRMSYYARTDTGSHTARAEVTQNDLATTLASLESALTTTRGRKTFTFTTQVGQTSTRVKLFGGTAATQTNTGFHCVMVTEGTAYGPCIYNDINQDGTTETLAAQYQVLNFAANSLTCPDEGSIWAAYIQSVQDTGSIRKICDIHSDANNEDRRFMEILAIGTQDSATHDASGSVYQTTTAHAALTADTEYNRSMKWRRKANLAAGAYTLEDDITAPGALTQTVVGTANTEGTGGHTRVFIACDYNNAQQMSGLQSLHLYPCEVRSFNIIPAVQTATTVAPTAFTSDPGISNGITDHGALTGRADDDHLQYILVDGTRDFTGEFDAVADTDATFNFGRVLLDARNTDQANFSHVDRPLSADRALSQTSAGATSLNASGGQSISLGVGGAGSFLVTSGQFAAQNPNGPAFRAEIPSAINPTVITDKSDLGTGIGGVTGTLSLITGDTEALLLDASQDATFANHILASSGTVGNPGIAFSAVPSSGMFISGGTLIIVGFGSNSLSIGSTGTICWKDFYPVSTGNVDLGITTRYWGQTFSDMYWLTEQSAAVGSVATKGQFWLRDDAPNVLMFTDDAAVDWQLSGVGAAGGTLDASYDYGGAGLGRSILATDGSVDVRTDGVANTSTVGMRLANDTLAIAGITREWAPTLDFAGNVWNTTGLVNETHVIRLAAEFGPGSNPIGFLYLRHIDNGVPADSFRFASYGQMSSPSYGGAGATIPNIEIGLIGGQTGIYSAAGLDIGITISGTTATRWDTSRRQHAGNHIWPEIDATYDLGSGSGEQWRYIYTSGGLVISGAGLEATPAIRIGVGGDTGLYEASANALGFSTGGTQALLLDAIQDATFAGHVSVAQGNRFVLDGNGGDDYITAAGANQINFYTNGSSRVVVTNVQLTSQVNVSMPGLVMGGQTITDILISSDGASTSDTAFVTPGWLDSNTIGGITALSVANIDDPSTELNAISGAAKGDARLCYETIAGKDEWTLYAWDDADSGTEAVPSHVDGLTGLWTAIAGTHTNTNTINTATVTDFKSNAAQTLRVGRSVGNVGYLQFYGLGSESDLNIRHASDGGTGVAWEGTDELLFVTGATEGMRINASQQVLLGIDGLSSNPALAFKSEPGLGIYRGGGATLYFAAAAARRMTLSSVELRVFVPAEINIQNIGVAETIGMHYHNQTAAALGAQQYSPMLVLEGQGWDDTVTQATAETLMSMQLQPVQVASSLPTADLVFKSNINAAGYTEAARLSSGGDLTVQGTIYVPPGLGIRGETATTTGMDINGNSDVRLLMSAAVRHVFTATYHRISPSTHSSAAPAIRITDADSGCYRPASQQWGIATAASPAVEWDATQNMTAYGHVSPDTDSANDLGLTGTRWRELFVDDITVTNDIAMAATGQLQLDTDGDTYIASPSDDVMQFYTGALAITIGASQETTFGGQAGTDTFILSAAAATISTDCNDGNSFEITLALNGPYTLANPTNGKKGFMYTWNIVQDSATRALSFGTLFKFPSGVTPTVSPGNGETDLLSAYFDGTNFLANYTNDHS